MIEITPVNQMRLEIKRLVGNDTAAAQAAIEFIKDDQLKYELFKDAYNHCGTETQFVARAQKAAREAQESLDLFE
ncbi:DUF2560 family protein [Providencia heimbachae]|uniref:DUF2560 family protein n=1 Tax=Providencia heimbachae TaxID=333962 RepID=UPI00141912B6|nr:DUF2560 family protein [Providencia heimbachae]NIH21846.1 DUF2560 family protein [Providencia heimbachae]